MTRNLPHSDLRFCSGQAFAHAPILALARPILRFCRTHCDAYHLFLVEFPGRAQRWGLATELA